MGSSIAGARSPQSLDSWECSADQLWFPMAMTLFQIWFTCTRVEKGGLPRVHFLQQLRHLIHVPSWHMFFVFAGWRILEGEERRYLHLHVCSVHSPRHLHRPGHHQGTFGALFTLCFTEVGKTFGPGLRSQRPRHSWGCSPPQYRKGVAGKPCMKSVHSALAGWREVMDKRLTSGEVISSIPIHWGAVHDDSQLLAGLLDLLWKPVVFTAVVVDEDEVSPCQVLLKSQVVPFNMDFVWRRFFPVFSWWIIPCSPLPLGALLLVQVAGYPRSIWSCVSCTWGFLVLPSLRSPFTMTFSCHHHDKAEEVVQLFFAPWGHSLLGWFVDLHMVHRWIRLILAWHGSPGNRPPQSHPNFQW